MRAFAFFVAVQIAVFNSGIEISGIPVGPERDQTPNKEFDKLQESQSFSDVVDLGLSVKKLRHETTTPTKMECSTKEQNAENAAVEGMATYFNSFIKLANKTLLEFVPAANAVHGGLESVVEVACHWLERANNLSKTSNESFKRCWSPEECASEKLVFKVWSALVQYTCQNGGSRVLGTMNTFAATIVSSTIPNVFALNPHHEEEQIKLENYEMNSRSDNSISLSRKKREIGTVVLGVVGLIASAVTLVDSYKNNGSAKAIIRPFGAADTIRTKLYIDHGITFDNGPS